LQSTNSKENSPRFAYRFISEMHKIGSRVVLVDLEASPWLNGAAGVIEAHDQVSARFTVKLDFDGSTHSVSLHNLRLEQKPNWKNVYSRWLDGMSTEIAAAVEAASEVTTVLVPGLVVKRPPKDAKPAWNVPLRYILLLCFCLVITPLMVLPAPLAQLCSVVAFCFCSCVACSSLRRALKLVIILSGCFGILYGVWLWSRAVDV
jgi:hypothetical protein